MHKLWNKLNFEIYVEHILKSQERVKKLKIAFKDITEIPG